MTTTYRTVQLPGDCGDPTRTLYRGANRREAERAARINRRLRRVAAPEYAYVTLRDGERVLALYAERGHSDPTTVVVAMNEDWAQ